MDESLRANSDKIALPPPLGDRGKHATSPIKRKRKQVGGDFSHEVIDGAGGDSLGEPYDDMYDDDDDVLESPPKRQR